MTAHPRQSWTIDELKAMLTARADAVARRYAPEAPGSYSLHGGWWTLNPGRADRSVGSFVVWTEGQKAGRWNDYATAEHGDLIDLIRLAQGGSMADALIEARNFLGLTADDPAARRRRQAEIERQQAHAAEARRTAAATAETTRRRAVALWLGARDRIAGTPVEFYLRDRRGIDLARLGRQPRALRFHPGCYWTHTDPETGEVLQGRYPAMLAIASAADGRPVAVHRTWLALDPKTGRWDKAPLPAPKKVLGDYRGAAIHIWSGLGPRGGKGRRLAEAEPGSHLYLTEGIEDALSVVDLLPEARVLAAISLSGLASCWLPPAIASLTIVGDRDPGEPAQAALARAIAARAAEGRTVRLWQNDFGGKDLNDALRQAQTTQEEPAG